MANWTDLSGAFGYGTQLTSTQMQNLRDNITALAEGASGAPAIEEAAMDAASVNQAALKTAYNYVSHTGTSLGNYTLPGGQYGFRERIYMSYTGAPAWQATICGDGSTTFAGWTSAITNISLRAGAGTYIYGWQRYVTASGEAHWIFILRDKITKEIIGIVGAEDHPCMGNGGDPSIVTHPFPDFKVANHEILAITFDPDDPVLLAIKKSAGQTRCLAEVILTDYDIDETVQPAWPAKLITVGLPPDWDEAWTSGQKVTPIKMAIPKPAMVTMAGLKLKGI